MQRHLYAVPRPLAPRPAKVVQLDVRRQERRAAERQQQQQRPRPRPAA